MALGVTEGDSARAISPASARDTTLLALMPAVIVEAGYTRW